MLKEQETQKNIEEKLTAILALLANYMGMDKNEEPQVELILHSVGFSPTKIAKMIGKKPDTVIKIIKRLTK